MASCARKEIIRQGKPGIFHCWSRCVRRSFLLGEDSYTGLNYDHRRVWVMQRLELLLASFAIDLGFFAVLSNHLHLVLRTFPRLASQWGREEVARRWLRVYPGNRVLDGQPTEPTEEQVRKLAEDKKQIEVLRTRLMDVSWFMAALKEFLARRCNREDQCRGHFWEARFGSRELLDESALLICGLYVDLNPIRAGEARTLEDCQYASIGLRIEAAFAEPTPTAKDLWLAPLTLAPQDLGDVPSSSGARISDKGLLDLSRDDYVKLLEYTRTQIQAEQVEPPPESMALLLARLGIANCERFVEAVKNFPRIFRRLAGKAAKIKERAAEIQRGWAHGINAARQIFSGQPAP